MEARELNQIFIENSQSQLAWCQLEDAAVGPAIVSLFNDFEKSEQAQEILIEIIGEECCKKYLGKRANTKARNRKILYPPYMLPQVRKQLERNVESELVQKLERTLHKSDIAPEMDNYSKYLSTLCSKYTEDNQIENRGAADILGSILCQTIHATAFKLPLVEPICNDVYPGGSREKWEERIMPSRKALLKSCVGRSLPPSVRKFILCDSLFEATYVQQCQLDAKRSMRERGFILDGGDVHYSMSKIHNLIGRLVDESFQSSFRGNVDRACHDLPLEKMAKDVLNAYYIFNGSHHPALLPMLLPLLIELGHQYEDEPFVFVAMLSRFNQAFPRRREAAVRVSQTAWNLVKQTKPSVAEWISRIVETHRAQQNSSSSGRDLDVEQGECVLFLPWIECAFVGLFKYESAMFCWTECLLPGCIEASSSVPTNPKIFRQGIWDSERFAQIIAASVGLLEEPLLQAQSIAELERIFGTRPIRLHTKDIREAVSRTFAQA